MITQVNIHVMDIVSIMWSLFAEVKNSTEAHMVLWSFFRNLLRNFVWMQRFLNAKNL